MLKNEVSTEHGNPPHTYSYDPRTDTRHRAFRGELCGGAAGSSKVLPSTDDRARRFFNRVVLPAMETHLGQRLNGDGRTLPAETVLGASRPGWRGSFDHKRIRITVVSAHRSRESASRAAERHARILQQHLLATGQFRGVAKGSTQVQETTRTTPDSGVVEPFHVATVQFRLRAR